MNVPRVPHRYYKRQSSQRAIETFQPYAIEHRIVRSDGSVRWVQELAEFARAFPALRYEVRK